ncbi:MAG: heavy metal-responsive transcriptional regulator [Acidobacteria bacterium]|nr:heavy metal-responsive transcriptional regulator [Acidobacteriota bacterium]
MEAKLSIGRVARAARVSVQTIRYYERLGLLAPARRTANGYRADRPEATERLAFIKHAQALGFSLDEIKAILRLKYAGQSPCECVRKLLEDKLGRVERQIAELRRFRVELRKTLVRARRLPRLPHSASVICPIIHKAPAGESPSKRSRMEKSFPQPLKQERSGNPAGKEN